MRQGRQIGSSGISVRRRLGNESTGGFNPRLLCPRAPGRPHAPHAAAAHPRRLFMIIDSAASSCSWMLIEALLFTLPALSALRFRGATSSSLSESPLLSSPLSLSSACRLPRALATGAGASPPSESLSLSLSICLRSFSLSFSFASFWRRLNSSLSSPSRAASCCCRRAALLAGVASSSESSPAPKALSAPTACAAVHSAR
jgi:hypothetical protein